MKKRITVIFLCVALLSLSACGSDSAQTTTTQATSAVTAAEPESSTAPVETQTEAPDEPETYVAATVSVDFATDSMLSDGQYETFTAVESPQTRIILSTNATVRDFKVLALTNGDFGEDGEMHFDIEELYTLARLTADRPLVVSTTFYGLIPNNGVSYVDETGAVRTFAVDMSGEDGSLYLWEIE